MSALGHFCRLSYLLGSETTKPQMAFLVPLPPVVVSRPAFPDYTSVVKLVVAHNCDYPEEIPRLWRPNIKLPPWQRVGERPPVLDIVEKQEAFRGLVAVSRSSHPDYEASTRLWIRTDGCYPETRQILWQPRVRLPPLGDTSRHDCELDLSYRKCRQQN